MSTIPSSFRAIAALKTGTTAPIQHLRQGLQTPQPWLIFQRRGDLKTEEAHRATILRWCRDLEALTSLDPPTCDATFRAASGIVHELIQSASIGDMALFQYWAMCERRGAVKDAFETLVEAENRGFVRDIAHYVWYLRVINRGTNLSDACTAAAALSRLLTEESIWCRELQDGFQALKFKAMRAESDELIRFIDRGMDQLVAKIGNPVGVTHFAFLPSSAACTEGWGASEDPVRWTLAKPFPVQHSILRRDDRSRLEQLASTGQVAATAQHVDAVFQRLREQVDAARCANLASMPYVLRDRSLMIQSIVTTAMPSELYHYLIVSMASSFPAMVLRTVRRMKDCGITPLDVTLAVAICTLDGLADAQLEVLTWALDVIRERTRLELDLVNSNNASPIATAYWSYNAVHLCEEANAFSEGQLWLFLAENLPPESVCRLLSAFNSVPLSTLLVNSDISVASASTSLGSLASKGPGFAGAALDFVANSAPGLDISLIGRFPGFHDYIPGREFALGPRQLELLLRTRLETKEGSPILTGAAGSAVIVVDSSVIESGVDLRRLTTTTNSVVVVPYATIADLRGSDECLLTLRQLVDAVVVLHFSECLPALALRNCDSVNSTILAVAEMISVTLRESTVVVYTSDPEMIAQLRDLQHEGGKIGLMTGSATELQTSFALPEFVPALGNRPESLPSEQILTPEIDVPMQSWMDAVDGSDDADPREPVTVHRATLLCRPKSVNDTTREFHEEFGNESSAELPSKIERGLAPWVWKKDVRRQANHLASQMRGQVPWELKYRRFKVNVNDPRNGSILESFEQSKALREERRDR